MLKKVVSLSLVAAFMLFVSTFAFAADNIQSRHRVGASFGLLVPTGSYEEDSFSADFKNGPIMGIEYRGLLTKMFGLGGFLEVSSFSTETEKFGSSEVDIDVTVVTLGASASVERKFANSLTVYGAGKLGIAFTNVDVEMTRWIGTTTSSDSGRAPALMVEAGIRCPIYKQIDLGVAAKYSYIPQETGGGDDKSNLGGFALVGQIGYNF